MLTAFLSAKDAKDAKEAKIADGRPDCVAFAEPVIFFRSSLRPLRTNALFQLRATCLVKAGLSRELCLGCPKARGQSPPPQVKQNQCVAAFRGGGFKPRSATARR
jgi:hypothetical protein